MNPVEVPIAEALPSATPEQVKFLSGRQVRALREGDGRFVLLVKEPVQREVFAVLKELPESKDVPMQVGHRYDAIRKAARSQITTAPTVLPPVLKSSSARP